MATASTILIVMFTINIGLLFFQGFDSGGTALASWININAIKEGRADIGTEVQNNLKINLLAAVSTATLAGAAAFFFSNQQNAAAYSLTVWLIVFAMAPIGILTSASIPFMIKAVFGFPIMIAFILSLVGFFRGYEV